MNNISGINNLFNNYTTYNRQNTQTTKKTENAKTTPHVKGRTVGEPALSEEADKYYDSLQKKYKDMDFVLVSHDKIDEVKANPQLYGKTDKTVVLIDEDKVEKMAVDEDARKKYEGAIETARTQLPELKNAIDKLGIKVDNFGFSINDDGTTSFFASAQKATEAQTKRIEQKRELKREEAKKERKAENAERLEKQIEKAREDNVQVFEDDKNLTILTDSVENLISAIKEYGIDYFEKVDSNVPEEEKNVGKNIDLAL